jgi:hypothetical protein
MQHNSSNGSSGRCRVCQSPPQHSSACIVLKQGASCDSGCVASSATTTVREHTTRWGPLICNLVWVQGLEWSLASCPKHCHVWSMARDSKRELSLVVQATSALCDCCNLSRPKPPSAAPAPPQGPATPFKMRLARTRLIASTAPEGTIACSGTTSVACTGKASAAALAQSTHLPYETHCPCQPDSAAPI